MATKCYDCPLARTARACSPRGAAGADIVVVGEAPGPTENRMGTVFVGKAGERLDAWLTQAGIQGRVYLTNLIRCFPGYVQKQGRNAIAKPSAEVITRCHGHLWEDLARLRPKVVVVMGEVAIRYFTGLSQVYLARERSFQLNGVPGIGEDAEVQRLSQGVPVAPLLPTYHPAATLYGQDEQRKQRYGSMILADLVRARELADGVQIPRSYLLVEDLRVLQELVDTLLTAWRFGPLRYVVIDCETTGLNWQRDKLVGLGLSWKPHTAVFIPWDHVGIACCSAAWRAGVRGQLNRLLAEVPVANQNLKYDLSVLREAGVEARHLYHDTLLSSWWLDGDTTPHGLEDLAAIHLSQFGHKQEMQGELRKVKGFAQIEQIPVSVLVEYACGDADKTWQLVPVMEQRLAEQGTAATFRDLVMDQIFPALDMERRGVTVDRALLDRMIREYRRSLDEFQIWFDQTLLATMFAQHLERQGLITVKRPARFRPSASGDVRMLLYDVMRIPPHEDAVKTRVNKDGSEELSYSAAAKFREQALLYCLDQVQVGGPQKGYWELAAEFLRRYNEYAHELQIHKMYLKPLPNWIGTDGRIHTVYWIGCTASGRSAASDPSIHTLPQKYGVRDAFIPSDPLGLILNCDQSQCELRVLACLSGDPYLRAAFESGQDIHTMTAARLFRVPAERVTKEQRKITKTVVFGLIYGRGAAAIAVALQITEKDAQDLIDRFFAEFPGVRAYIDRVAAFLRRHGFVYNWTTGRRRPVPAIYSDNRKDAAKALRVATNSPVQGTASDLTAEAEIRSWEAMQAAQLRSHLFGFTHDSLATDIAPDELLAVAQIQRQEMQIQPPRKWPWITVPLRADFEVGVNWGQLTPVQFDFPAWTATISGAVSRVDAVLAVLSAWPTYAGAEIGAVSAVEGAGLEYQARVVFHSRGPGV